MSEPKEDSPRSVTLERLIQLKRSERPAAEFWEEFEREFQQRRLASLVTVSPWYTRAARVALLALRKGAPLGVAATALALAVHLTDDLGVAESESPAVAIAEPDLRLTTLPAEYLSSSHVVADVSAAPAESTARIQSRHAVNELGINRTASSGFITVTSPLTFSSVENEDFTLETLSSVPVLRPAQFSTSRF